MKCEELLKQLNDYVEGTVDPSICGEFAHHLSGCNPCQVVVDNLRQTLSLFQAGEPHTLPTPFQQRLHLALREKWQKKLNNKKI